MSKKDYILIARILKDSLVKPGKDAADQTRVIAESLAVALKSDNAAFDMARFLNACQPN